MALYKKEGSPFWWADIRFGGRRYRVSTKETTKGAARTSETALIQQLSSGERKIGQKAPVLRDYAVSFLGYIEKTRLADETKRYYKNGWRMLGSRPIAGMRIDSITKSDVEVLGIPGSGSTVNCALRTLKRMLKLAEEKDLISKVPRIHLVEENMREALIDAQVEAVILAKAPRVLRDAYLLIADCGIRPSDAVQLGWQEDVNFVDREILIAGGKTGRKGRRIVKMSTRVYDMLIRRAQDNEAWVFPSVKHAGEHMTAQTISSWFSGFKREQGLPKDVVLYSARHTFATDLTEATGDVTKTQKTLGHTKLNTTLRYVHSTVADTGRIMDARNAERHYLGHSKETVQ